MTEEEKKKLEPVTEIPGTQASSQAGALTPMNGYQSKWSGQIDDVFGKIQNRKPFQYDVNADALYEQYKNQYINNGRLAMEDTIGQAATLTGGYDNSYAHSVGQQTYNRYLEGLNDRVPELYQMALNRYMQEGDDLRNDYALLMDRDSLDYGRYQDAAALAKSQVEAMLALGVRPSDDLIKQSGLSQEYINAFMAQFAGSGGGSSSGGSSGGRRGGGSSGGGNGTGWTAGDDGDNIDYDSINKLGYGPISGDDLAGKVSDGDVFMYQNDNNQISFGKTPPKPGSLEAFDEGTKNVGAALSNPIPASASKQENNDKKWWQFWK